MKNLFLAGLTVVMALTAGTAGAWVGEETLGVPGSTPSDIKTFYVTGMRTLSPDTLYHLQGIYYVDTGATLNIPAGTTIFGHPFGTVVVKPGGTINATGEQANPIVFTSSNEPENRFPGDWGGIVILGNATVNKTNPNIEGGIIEDSLFGVGPECDPGDPSYPNCDDDSSGIFRYVRIEFPGYRFADGNEINGLTMGGVGRGTELHHVQVSYSWDDSYEWFGGTVNAKYLVAFGGTDDEFDTDFGYRGRQQFLFGLRDPDYWDTDASNGFESDNDDPASEDTPRTAPVVSNATLIGPDRTDALVGTASAGGRRFQDVARPRRHTRLSVFNSVLYGYQKGMAVRNELTQQECLSNILRWQNISMANGIASGDCGGTIGYPDAIHDCGDWDGVCDWFTTPAFNNWGSDARLPSTLGLTDVSDLNNPNPVPAAGSELIGSGVFTDSYLADAFFDVVDYRGAFEPGVPMGQQWTAYWTNFDPEHTVYDGVSAVGDDEIQAPAQLARVRAYPNPFNPSTTISFSVPRDASITLKMFDARGREVATLFDGSVSAGREYSVVFNGEGLASGTYFYRLQGNGYEATAKVQLVK